MTGEIVLDLPINIEIIPEQVRRSLAHKWRISRISRDTTPYVQHPTDERGRLRGASAVHYEEISSTEAGPKVPSYVLNCSVVSSLDLNGQ